MRSQGTWSDQKYGETKQIIRRALEIAERAKNKKATDKKPRSSPGHVTLGSKPKPSALRNGTLPGAKTIDLKCFLIRLLTPKTWSPYAKGMRKLCESHANLVQSGEIW